MGHEDSSVFLGDALWSQGMGDKGRDQSRAFWTRTDRGIKAGVTGWRKEVGDVKARASSTGHASGLCAPRTRSASGPRDLDICFPSCGNSRSRRPRFSVSHAGVSVT